MEIKYTARVEYTTGHASDFDGFGCKSFTNEAAADAWAAEQLRNDPGAIVTVWKAFTADIHRIYHGR